MLSRPARRTAALWMSKGITRVGLLYAVIARGVAVIVHGFIKC
jgi:hypothetical protein